MYSHIINPSTNRKVSIYSKKGQEIIKQYILKQIGGKKDCPNCYAFTKSEKDEIKTLKKNNPKTNNTQREQMVCEKYGHIWTHGKDSRRNINGDCCKCWCCGKLNDSSESKTSSSGKTTRTASKVSSTPTITPVSSKNRSSRKTTRTVSKVSSTSTNTPVSSKTRSSRKTTQTTSTPPSFHKISSPLRGETKSFSKNNSGNSTNMENKMECPHCSRINDLSPTMTCIYCGKDMLTLPVKQSVNEKEDTCYYTPSGKKRSKGPTAKACKNKNVDERCCVNPPHNQNCQWCIGDGCRSIETKCGSHSKKSSKKSQWIPNNKKGEPVTKALRDYITHISNDTHIIGALESGGDGDCLYHSISSGLNHMKQNVPTFIDTLESLYNGGNDFNMRSLRRISAMGLDSISNNVFINHYINFLGQESARSWKDKWSPKLLAEHIGGNIVNITKYNNVHYVTSHDDGSVEILGDTIHMVSSGKSICSICNALVPNSDLDTHKTGRCRRAKFREHFVNQEEKYVQLIVRSDELENLKTEVKNQIMTTGNHHWGVDLDITNISNTLGIGIIVLKNRGNPLIYCLPSDYTRFNYYMLIYNKEGSHYQLGILKNKTNNQENCYYSCRDLPIWLKSEFNRLCKENSIECPP